MLKRSTRTMIFDLTKGQEELLNGVFYIIDHSLKTQYYPIFELVYKNPEKLNLEQVATRCYISRHTLIDGIEVVNRLIQNTLFFFQNCQIIIIKSSQNEI